MLRHKLLDPGELIVDPCLFRRDGREEHKGIHENGFSDFGQRKGRQWKRSALRRSPQQNCVDSPNPIHAGLMRSAAKMVPF
jgi:hypothetical protein